MLKRSFCALSLFIALFFQSVFQAKAEETTPIYQLVESDIGNFLMDLPEMNPETLEITTKKYNLVLNNPFGNPEGNSGKYYKWTTTDLNQKHLVDESLPSAADVVFSFDESDYAAVYKNQTYVVEVDEQGALGALWKVGEGEETSIEDVLLLGNTVEAQAGVGINSDAVGGFIFNKGTIKNIRADFIDNTLAKAASNSVTGTLRGAVIANEGIIENIDANFVSNTFGEFGEGSAIYNKATIGTISGNFIRNYVDSEFGGMSGAINNQGNIKHIKANFIGNFQKGEHEVYHEVFGSVILNTNTIDLIEGVFIGNGTLSDYTYTDLRGGAVYNAGIIKSIQADFIGNSSQWGGAIHNAASLDVVSGRFLGNHAEYGGAIESFKKISAIHGDFIGNCAKTYGGAIYLKNGDSTISGRFIGNYVDNEDPYVIPCGGAICSTKNLTVLADNDTTLFKGNYTLSNGEKDDNAIYIIAFTGSASLVLKAQNGGVISMYDNIRFFRGTNATLTGDETGIINLYNNIYDTNVVTQGKVKVNTANKELYNYVFKSLKSDENTKYAIDIDLGNKNSDVIQTSNSSEGRVTLDGLNLFGIDFENIPDALITTGTVVQVLQTQTDDLQLALSDTLNPVGISSYALGSLFAGEEVETLEAENVWGKDYYTKQHFKDIYGRVWLDTTDTTNDSVGIILDRLEDREDVNTILGDTLEMLASSDLTNKTFEAESADDEYVFGKRFEQAFPEEYLEGIGTVEKDLSISGVIEGDERSVLNLNLRKGFEYQENSDLTLSNIEITDANGFVVTGVLSGTALKLVNANLKNNVAADGGVLNASGGQISVFADGADSVFDNPAALAGIDIQGGILDLQAQNGGNVVFEDDITGRAYNIEVDGDGTGEVRFNQEVSGANLFSVKEGAKAALGIHALMNATNMTSSDAGAFLTVDAEVDRAANTIKTGKIVLEGDVSGTIGIVVNALNTAKLDNDDDAIVPFLIAPNDDISTPTDVSVARVMGSPYMWETIRNAKGEERMSIWYLALRSGGTGGEVAPEVGAAVGLHESAIEQTRSLARNISGKLAASRECFGSCGVYDRNWNGQPLQNAWVLVEGETADIKKPVDVDAKIKGIEAGFDIQSDAHNNLGVFASYRNGKYNLSGKGKLVSLVGSKIDIDSYLAGLYFRHDRANNYLFASLYGGIQKADVKTKDGAAKFNTDGTELGAALEAGHTFLLQNKLTLTPLVGLYYTQINFESAKDNVGKRYQWDTIKHLEAELGARLAKDFAFGSVYVKPSVVQNITGGNKVRVTGLNKQSTYKDNTLGRVELGGRYDITEKLSGYISGKYSFGSDYDALAGTLGLSYTF